MNKFYNRFFVVIAGSALLASSFSPVFAQSPELQEKLNETKEEVSKLLEVKDSTNLTQNEKERKETELKINILLSVIELSKTQLSDLSKQLEKLSLPSSEEWEALRDSLQSSIKEADAYYSSASESIEKKRSLLFLEDVKKIGQDLEAKKKAMIDPLVIKLNNIIVAFSIDPLLSLADTRLEKIELDINKIYNKNLTKNPALKKLFVDASALIEESHKNNSEAKEIILRLYTITNPEKDEFLNEVFDSITSSTATSSTPNATPSFSTSKIDSYISALIVESIDNLQDAYDVFIKMSTNAQNYLK